MVKGVVRRNPEVRAGFEIIPEALKVLAVAKSPLPLGVIDKVRAELDTRLDARYIDLRKPEVAAIFKIRSTILKAVREQFDREGFIEIHTPKIVATATEGGTALFPVEYFGHQAFLNQSPQLYKQMMMATGLDKVYEIGPAFRAEEHDTVRHLNEFISIDMEMAFADEEDVMGVLERVVHRAIVRVIETNRNELEILNVKLEVPELPFPRVTYTKCLEYIEAHGIKLPWGEDISMEGMKALSEHYPGFFFITRWPTKLKPFYALPFDDDPRVCRAFDLNFGEKEITSGAQRVHNAELLRTNLSAQNLMPDEFTFYINAFEYGMPPHAGWGLGIERFTMILTNTLNIRECVLFPRDKSRLVP
jgi:aspartyl-tRNA synthetase